MLTEDYIMRMINQALAVFLAALGLKNAKKYKQSLETFDQAIQGLLGLDSHLVNQLDDSLLLDRLMFMGKIDIERSMVLADIYCEEAEVYQVLGQLENSQFAAQRSLRLYLEAGLANQSNLESELIQKIESLRGKMDLTHLPIELRLPLQDYFDRLLASSDDFLNASRLSRSDLKTASDLLESLS